jgi:hypothetical protein
VYSGRLFAMFGEQHERKTEVISSYPGGSSHPNSWALCSPVRYKMPTTHDMTGLSETP